MLPSDFLQHQSLTQPEGAFRNSFTKAPPPQYSEMPSTTPISGETLVPYLTNDDEDEDDISPTSAPISIKIDASIKVEGNANTIVLPPTTVTRFYALPGREGPSCSPHQCSGLQVGQARAGRLSEIVLAALVKAQAFAGSDADGSQRPVEVQVNASIDLKGHRNILSEAAPRALKRSGAATDSPPPPPSSPACRDGIKDRKRRAHSEPPSPPSAKKIKS